MKLKKGSIVALRSAVLLAAAFMAASSADTPLTPTQISAVPSDPALITPDPADASIPDKWQEIATSPYEPIRSYYLGGIRPLGFSDPHHKDSFHSIDNIWGKVVYVVLQDSPKGKYQVDIFNVKLNCWTLGVTTLREVRLAPDGRVVLDSHRVSKETRISKQAFKDNLSYLPLAQGIAADADDWACGADTPD
jgi:hypothetical protein